MSETPEFQRLYDLRELALIGLLGVVQHAIGNLNLSDPPAALRTLLKGLETYTLADAAITEFHVRKTSQSEKENIDGNRTAAA